MRKGQFIAMLLSAVLTVSSVVPLSVLEAAAAESTESGITVETEQEEEIPPEAADVAEQAQEGDTEPEAAEPEESAPEEPAEGEPEETVPEEPAEGEQEEQPAEAAEDDSAEEAETAGETSEESMQDTDTQEETGTIEEEPDAEISGTGVTEPAVVETEESQTGATANEAAADNHFKAYLKGFADTYDTIDINLGPGEERQLQVIAEADDYSGMTYTWKKNDEKIREITAEEIIRQNGEPSSDTITVTGDEKARYEVEVSDGISDPVRISFYVSVNNEFWAYPDGTKMRDNSIPDSSTELYARTGEEVTLNVCVHAVDKNRITYKWYDGNYDEIEGESSGSLIVTAGNESMSFMCIVNDGYGNSCDVDFYISPLNTFSAYPEGAAMDEFGNIADTAQISADLGEKITLRVVTKAQEGIELSYHWADSEGNVLKDQGDGSITVTAKSAVDYECTVTDQYGKEVTVHFAVTVNHFKVYPENADVSSSGEKQKTKRIIAETGDAVNLKAVVSADNVKNISYQWVKEDQETGKRKALSNKTSSLKVTVDKYCWYYCTVSDSYDNREQVVFIIEANNFSAYPENPVITGEGNKCSDKTLEAAKGEKLVLRVVTESKSGTGFHYKWYEEKIVNGYPEMVEMSDPDQTDSRYGSSLKVTAANTVSYRCDVSRDDSIYRESVNFTVHVTGTDIPSISSDAPEYDGYEYTYRVTPGEECPMHAIVDNGGQTSGYEIVWLDQDKRVLAEGTDTYTVTVTEDKRYICKVTGSNSRTASADFRVIPDSGLTALPAGITEENYDSDRNRIQITAEPSREIELKVESSVSNNLELHYFWQGRTFDHEGNETSGWQYFDSDSPLLKVSVDEDTRFECLVRDDYGNKKTVIFDVLVSDSKDLNRAIVKLEQSELPYTGKPVKPGVTVYFKGNKLTEGTDYTLKYFNNVNPDLMPSVLVTGAGEYTGKVSLYFRISKLEQNLKITIPSVTTGATGKITVKNAKGHLYYDVVSGRSVVSVDEKGTLKGLKVGTAKIFIGSSEAKGYNEAGRTITVKVLLGAPAKLTATNMVTGVKLTWSRVPGATGYLVRRAGKTIRTISSGTTVSYIDTTANKNGTTYNYTIFARNKAGTGKVYKAVSIYRMSRPAFTSAQNSAAGTMTLKWGKNNAVTGYQIQYSLRSDFSGAKSVTIAKASATARTIKSLTKGKTYYVRIRCYKKTGSAKYYSLWSKTKKITIKK